MKSLAPTAGAAIPVDVEDARLAHRLLLPACGVIAAVVGFPLVWMVWESLHLHDLRMPWLGRPFVGLANYREAIADPRFRSAMAHRLEPALVQRTVNRLDVIAAYAIGTVAAFWLIERTSAFFV